MSYDKTELNKFAQNLYNQKMQEGKHGHYETMFHVIHRAIERVAEIDTSPERVQEKAKCVHIKALALAHSQQCMAHHGTGPEVQAAWIEFCKAIDLGQT